MHLDGVCTLDVCTASDFLLPGTERRHMEFPMKRLGAQRVNFEALALGASGKACVTGTHNSRQMLHKKHLENPQLCSVIQWQLCLAENSHFTGKTFNS